VALIFWIGGFGFGYGSGFFGFGGIYWKVKCYSSRICTGQAGLVNVPFINFLRRAPMLTSRQMPRWRRATKSNKTLAGALVNSRRPSATASDNFSPDRKSL